ncbi:MAG: peptidoglycan-binding domain-containing protein [Acidimicrobiales bacterium]
MMSPIKIALGTLVGGGLGVAAGYAILHRRAMQNSMPIVPLGQSTTPIGSAAQTATLLGDPASAPMSVSEAQTDLNELGESPALAVDGISGPLTVAAIKAFQAKHNLTVDGILGPQTAAALRIALGETTAV